MLLVAAADRLGVVERQADLVLPECQRRRRIVGGKADIDARFASFMIASAERLRRGQPTQPPGDGEELRHGFLDDRPRRLYLMDQPGGLPAKAGAASMSPWKYRSRMPFKASGAIRPSS